MKQFLCCAVATLFLSTLSITPARAECYGDAASMYGCGQTAGTSKSVRRSGDLEHFGDSRAPVLPDFASSQDQGIDDVVTPQERRRMLRSIVLGTGRRSLSDRSYMQAINNSGRPVRRSGSVNEGGGR